MDSSKQEAPPESPKIEKTAVQIGDLIWYTSGPIKPNSVISVDSKGVMLDDKCKHPLPFERISCVVRGGIAYDVLPMHPFNPEGL